ncbi:hypothetical protein QE152_g31131 [Popillia japonica]|uniref:Uncharacterized protein n=1 Tax=Popillia japonica TaxID=7064 RepID=A0AAW1JCP7_POPJA
MESPVRKQPAEEKPGTPRCLVSPSTVKFLEERCRIPPPALLPPDSTTLPSPPILHLPSLVSPDLNHLSPGTENFIQSKPTGPTVDSFLVPLARYQPLRLPSPPSLLPSPSQRPSKPSAHPEAGAVKRRNHGPAWRRHRKDWTRHPESAQLQVQKCSASVSAV